MYTSNTASRLLSALGLFLLLGGVARAEEPPLYGFGRMATPAEISAWNIDIDPTGAGLPPGRGTVPQGAGIYANKCAICHGPTGTEGPKDRLVGGHGSLATDQPIKTIGSYWPYATTLYDYIYRAMPLTAPQSLTPDESYSVVAWLLHQNGIVPADAVIDAQTLPRVTMPNRAGFVSDPQPDVPFR
ncbi:MAG: c-type cytochrome [Nitrospira sp.]|nr:c-type cytochrome [Nitrospira sp.]